MRTSASDARPDVTSPTMHRPQGLGDRRGLTKSFGGVRAVDGATVEFHHGKINALIGPNGSGKTTFFNCVTGMIRPDAGTRELPRPRHHPPGAAPHRPGRDRPQLPAVPDLPADDRAGERAGRRPPHAASPRCCASARDRRGVERARGLLRRVGIDHLERAEARDLSYGQQKLLELAGVLMARAARRSCSTSRPAA